ncbi:MAG: hypothetical protein QF415_10190 [Candidatus Undinarchaeales archaeon]|jgi:hypothetical protein|nr:hypothetical protein [Candidatus Undinarchaeales archaeon]MDP7494203.1 hypothetical protein [Candidatus Undinarchaeales archaeon]
MDENSRIVERVVGEAVGEKCHKHQHKKQRFKLNIPTDAAICLDDNLKGRISSLCSEKEELSEDAQETMEDSVSLWVEGLGRSMDDQ